MDLQAQLLRSFLTQFASKEAPSADGEDAYAVEFLDLKRKSMKYRTEKTYITKAADRQENVKKNRYKDIVPFDHSRVKLSLNVSKNDNEYINANFIRGVFGPTEYIATQGPLPNTVLDFWRMLWEYDVQKKCERYWPETTANVFVCEPFTIYCESEQNKGDYLIRILKVTFNNSSRTLKQLHYMNWPDHGVPDSIPPILEMLQDMRVFQERDDVPICIHCSAGCGRTGVLCVIDFTWNLLKQQMIPKDFSIYDLVQDMRTQRPSIVQTKEQYELVYKAITFLFKKHLQLMESSSRQKVVPVAPPPIPVDTDSDFSESDEEDEEEEPVEENRVHLSYDRRFQKEEVPTVFSNHVAPSAVLQPLSPHLEQASLQDPQNTPVDMLNSMKNWAKSKIPPRFTYAPNNLQKTDIGYQKSQITKPNPVQEKFQTHHSPSLQERGHGQQKSQKLQSTPQQSTDLSYRKSQILETPSVQHTDLGYRKSQTPNPFPLQEKGQKWHENQKSQTPASLPLLSTGLVFQKSQVLDPPPVQSLDVGYRKSQVLDPPPVQSSDLGYRKSQVLDPPPVQSADLGFRKAQILDPPPGQSADLGFRKAQISKPPRIHKTDLECRRSQILEPPPVLKTNLGSQNSQITENSLLKQKDIECQKSDIVEPPPIQQPDFKYSKSQIPKPLRHHKADPGFDKPQVPEIAATNQTHHNDTLKSINHTSPTPVQVPSPHQIQQTEINNGGASLQTTVICLTVEDPYFGPDSHMSDSSTEETVPIPHFLSNPCYIVPTLTLKTPDIELPMQKEDTGVTLSISDEDSPPPLPERTPESYIMANEELPQILTPTHELTTKSPLFNDTSDIHEKSDSGNMDNMGVDRSLTLDIPPDTFPISKGESPPSPTPPLPERTPESFELANDKDLLQNAVQEKPQETVLRVGKSSEWSGNSSLNVPHRSWSRSKSLKARLSLNVPLNVQPFVPLDIASPEPPQSLTPPLPERTPDSFLMDATVTQAPFIPPLPRKTAESFIGVTVEEDQRNSAPCLGDSTQPRQRLGTSSEWAGNSEPQPLPDVMTRSKSVRVKGSRQEYLSVVSLPDPNTGASAGPALSREQDQRSLDCRHPAVEQPEIRSLPKKCRTKSLKLWKGKQKTKEVPASAAVPPKHGATAGFIFSFGTRFGKPKGPRSQPETWV